MILATEVKVDPGPVVELSETPCEAPWSRGPKGMILLTSLPPFQTELHTENTKR